MKKFKIGVLVDSFQIGALEGIKKAASLGVNGIQLYAIAGELAPENITKDKIKEINDVIASNGMVVSAVCGDLGGKGFRVKEDNPWKVEKSKRIMDLALELHSNIVTTHIGIVPKTKNDIRKIMSEACNELAEYGDNVGSYFAIETGPEPAITLKGFLDELTAKAVRVNFDPANLAMVIGENPTESVYTLKDYIVHTHAKDGIMINKTDPRRIYGAAPGDIIEELDHMVKFFKEVPLGTGDVNFDTYLKALEDIGYNGFLTIEREVGENPKKDIMLAIDFLKNKMGEL